MTNEEMLLKIREDRPKQVINDVLSFNENKYGFYDVQVDMESMFLETKILHTHFKLPYPQSGYEKLSKKEQLDWRWDYE